MARPTKKTVDYFPHLTKHGKTMFIIEQTWGNNGYAFWFKLLELLGASEYHFVDFNNADTWEFFIATSRVDEITANKILDKLSVLGSIDPQAWGCRVVYCHKFCENILDAYARRIDDKPNINRVYDYINTTYNKKLSTKTVKVKETKEKKSKYGEFANVLLTDEEHKKLKDKFNSSTNEYIERLSAYIAQSGKRYKSHYATILNWSRNDTPSKPAGRFKEDDI
jgi:hypothetical protein